MFLHIMRPLLGQILRSDFCNYWKPDDESELLRHWKGRWVLPDHKVFGKTDRGLVRPGNEDYLHIDREHGVYAVYLSGKSAPSRISSACRFVRGTSAVGMR